MTRFDVLSGNIVILKDGPYTSYAVAQAEINKLEQRAVDWEKACRDTQETIWDIGRLLGADTPRELVTAVAAERMSEIKLLRTKLELAEALLTKERQKTK